MGPAHRTIDEQDLLHGYCCETISHYQCSMNDEIQGVIYGY